MSMKRIFCLFAAALLCACGGRDGGRTVDVTTAAPADLEEVATFYELLPVDESETPLPAVTDVKRYGDKVFIKSGRYPDVPKIYMLAGDRLAGVLDAYGRGPGEYQDAEGFAFCEQTSELIINDRILKGFRRYRVPEMKWVSDEPLGQYLAQFESLDATHSVFAFEAEEGEPGSVVVWDHAKSEVTSSLETSYLEAILLTDLHLGRASDGSIVFGLIGHDTRFWGASAGGFKPAGAVTFVPDAFGPHVWEQTLFEKAFEAFRNVVEEGKNVGIGADFPLVKGDRIAFWYLAGFSVEPNWRLAVSAPDGGKAYSEVRVEGYPEPLQVVGSGEAQWCSILLLDLLEDVPSLQGKLYPRLHELKDRGCETVLLFWSAV